MKALIRKHGYNCRPEFGEEVWFEPWANADEQGRPYTLEGYRYALCENVPDTAPEGENDPRTDVANYTVEEHEVTEGEGEEQTTRRYWTATYVAPESAEQ